MATAHSQFRMGRTIDVSNFTGGALATELSRLFMLPPPVANSVFFAVFLTFMTFICIHTWLLYMITHTLHTHTYLRMGGMLTSLCTCSHVECYAPHVFLTSSHHSSGGGEVLTSFCTSSRVWCYATHVFLTWSHIPLDWVGGGLTYFMLRSTCLLYMIVRTANIFHPSLHQSFLHHCTCR